MNIRKYQEKDFEATKYVCIHDMIGKKGWETVLEYVETMFCRYYLEKEPENCFVAVDENDKPIGYIYGVKDYDKYQENFSEYINAVAEIENRRFLAEALTEMYDHAIYKKDYPAHLHIDILPDYQSKGIGSKLIKAFCDHLKASNIKGVMLIVGTDNDGARRFYERNGFVLLQDMPTGAAYGMKF
ncbi:MAG: GNAT family N-acetyltransferase [Ruminococcaceae bacterium]|nr:GNAT family N-acetyltransferase [Oscillospiraceae bacterium]